MLRSAKSDLFFAYTPDGNRCLKVVNNGAYADSQHYTYYVRDFQGNVMATYTRKIHDMHLLTNADYPRLIDAIQQTIDANSYAHFMANTFSSNGSFVSGLRYKIDSASLYGSIYNAHYNELWFAQHDATLATTVIALYADADVLKAVMAQDAQYVLRYITSTASSLSGLTDEYLNYMCDSFLYRLEAHENGIISTLYNLYYSPTTPPTTAQMISDLCGMPPTNFSTDIVNNANHQNLADAMSEFSPTVSWNAINTVYSSGDKHSFRLHAEGHTDILAMLYAYDATTFVTGLTDAQKEDKLVSAQANNYVYYSVLNDPSFSNKVMRNLFPIQVLVDAMQSSFTTTILDDIWTIINGNSGNIKDALSLSELYIYGSKRIGLLNADTLIRSIDLKGTLSIPNAKVDVETIYSTFNLSLDSNYSTRIRGRKRYELSNHLGNVTVVVSDRKVPVDSNSDGIVDYWNGDTRSANDYYAFGSSISSRSYSGGYRWGYQKQEVDKELWGGAVNFKYRIENSGLGRFFSTDPLAGKYPFYSPYIFSGNIVINAIELEGLEPEFLNTKEHSNYNYILVISKNYRNEAAYKQDYNAAIKIGIPIMLVSNARPRKTVSCELKRAVCN